MGKRNDAPAAGSTGSGEPEAKTGLGAKVKDAFKRVATDENISLPPPSPDEEIFEDGQKPTAPKFPSREVRRAFIALGTWAIHLSFITKILVALCLGSAIALPIVVPILRQAPDQRKYYINRTESLLPVANPNAFEPLAELERNLQVEVLGSEESFALVRTESGRVGYVAKAAVSRDEVEVSAEDPFTNCTVRWNEKSPSLCQLRATAQQEHCSKLCAEEGSQTACTTACATNLALCMESCSGVRHEQEDEPTPTAAALVPDPTAPPTAAAAPPPSLDRPEGVVQLVPTKTEDEKKDKKKKRRKKKRRRRPPAEPTATVRMPEME